jgi:putative ABC transport system permease protein
MWSDNLRASWRGVLRNKATTAINVGGLALGLAVFFGLSFYVQREFSWDKHWQDAERIYRLVGRVETQTGSFNINLSDAPYVLGTSLQTQQTDAIETYARTLRVQSTIIREGEEFPNRSYTRVEPAFFEMFPLEFTAGSLQEVIAEPRAIAISARAAEKLYAKQSPLGLTLTLRSQEAGNEDFIVKAVYREPEPSVFGETQLLALLDPTALPNPRASVDLWEPDAPPKPGETPTTATPQRTPLTVSHYMKLREGVDANKLESALRSFMDDNKLMDYGTQKTRYDIQLLSDAHLEASPFLPGDNIQRLWTFAAVGVLVLLISGCNFVMLATLRMVDRMRAVGIRKTLGGGAGQLLRFYLVDAFLHTLVAATLALALLELVVPTLRAQLQVPFDPQPLSARNLGWTLLLVLSFTALSSGYPAWLLAKGKPSYLLRNGSGAVLGTGNTLRKILVMLQFAIVVVLLLATAVVQRQMAYTQNRDRGYSMENVVALRLRGDLISKVPALIDEFSRVPGVELAATGSASPGTFRVFTPPKVKALAPDGSSREAEIPGVGVGAGYFKALSAKLLAGREFSVELDTPPNPTSNPVPQPTNYNIVINEAGMRALGFASPEAILQQQLTVDRKMQDGTTIQDTLRVVGVLADMQLTSMLSPPTVEYYVYVPQNRFIAVKLEADAKLATVKPELERVWDSIMTDAAFTPLEGPSLTGPALEREELEASILTGSAVLALVIALMGLYGLVGATVAKRVREIGLRKAMGANSSSIVGLFLWQFSKPIMLANLLAWPLGLWAVQQWLQRFPYQLNLNQILLAALAASVLALLIAWLTVALLTAKAANTKPAQSLKYE